MTYVSEHNTKQKRKSDCGIKGWIYLLVRGYPIRIDYRLKDFGKLVCFEVRWRVKLFEIDFLDLELELSGRVG